MRVSSIIVASSEPLFAEMVARSLRRCSGVEVVATAQDVDRLAHLIDRRRPDLVVVDEALAGGGWSAVRRRDPGIVGPAHPRYLVVTDVCTRKSRERIRNQGAHGCVDRQADGVAIGQAVLDVVAVGRTRAVA